jgi:Secretion system C-terminal sorting domain
MLKRFTVLIYFILSFIFSSAYCQTKGILIFDPLNEYAPKLKEALSQICDHSISTTEKLSSRINDYNALFILLQGQNPTQPFLLSKSEENLLINYLKLGGSIYINSYLLGLEDSVALWNYIGINEWAESEIVTYVDSLVGVDSTFTKGLILHYRFSNGGTPIVIGNMIPILNASAAYDSSSKANNFFPAVFEAASDSFKAVLDLFPYYVNNPDYLSKILNYFGIPTVTQDYLSWYPLQVGNEWIYNSTTVKYEPIGPYVGSQYSYSISSKKVIGDTTMPNHKKYYIIYDSEWDTLFERIDTVTGQIFRYNTDTSLGYYEYAVDNLLANLGDTVNTHNHARYGAPYSVFQKIDTLNLFNSIYLERYFQLYGSLYGFSYSFAKGIGLDSRHYEFDFGDTYETLKGAIINGVIYGDTTITAIKKHENTPTRFNLSQNYPNPFNPTTIINYSIPAGQNVSTVQLKVYDILGRVVATLGNKEQRPGNYKVQFNASNLASGIYFYRLKAGEFAETKKLVLLK